MRKPRDYSDVYDLAVMPSIAKDSSVVCLTSYNRNHPNVGNQAEEHVFHNLETVTKLKE